MREPSDASAPPSAGDAGPEPSPAAELDHDLARRKLLKLAAYVLPAVTATIAVRNAGAATWSCVPNACAPNVCSPNRCTPICAPNGGCAPGSCGPVGCVPQRCGPQQ